MSNSILKNNYCLSGQQKIKFIENLNNEYNKTNGIKNHCDLNCYDKYYNAEKEKEFNQNNKQFNTLPPKDLKVYEGIRDINNESEIILSRSTRLSGRSNNVLSGVCIPRYIPQFIDVQNPKNIIMDIPRGGISTR